MALRDTSRSPSRPPVAVFDGSWPPALAFVRSLGRAGVPIHVYSHEAAPPARFSRYATRFERCPDPARLDPFQEWLGRQLQSGGIRLVAPTSDLILFHLALLERPPDEVARGIAPAQTLLSLIFKDRFDDACRQAGIPRPRTVAPRSPEQAVALARDLRFPVVLKPRSHVGLGGVRGRLVHSAEELRAAFEPFWVHPDNLAALRRFPDLTWPLVQEYVIDPGDGALSVAGAFAPDGRLLGSVVNRKWSQWPATMGIGTLFEGVEDPAVAALGCDHARRLAAVGLFELEFTRESRTGERLVLDVNPRGYGQMDLAMALGLDLPLLWYRFSLGEEVEPPPLRRADTVAWVYPWLFHISRAIDALRPRDEPRRHERSRLLRRQLVRAGTDWRDPAATLAFLGKLARQSVGIARAYLRRDE